jgi:GTP-binding protein
MADIPGLIEGAHEGVGLGHEFLRHVERTKVFVHLVEPTPMDQTDPIENFRAIQAELQLYDASLLDRPRINVVSKSELTDAEAVRDLLEESTGERFVLISAVTGHGLEELMEQIWRRIDEGVETGFSAR